MVGATNSASQLLYSSLTQYWFKCWATVYDAGPALKQHWINCSCLRGVQFAESSHVTIAIQVRGYNSRYPHPMIVNLYDNSPWVLMAVACCTPCLLPWLRYESFDDPPTGGNCPLFPACCMHCTNSVFPLQ